MTPANRTRPRLLALEDRLLPSVFTVTNTDKDGPGSFERALEQAAFDYHPTIDFDIPGPGVHTIERGRFVVYGDDTLVDATTQTGYAGLPLIELNGFDEPSGIGLDIEGDHATVRGLDLNGFRLHAILNNAGPTTIEDNFIGTDPSGTVAIPNGDGIVSDPGGMMVRQNLISGNRSTGVSVAAYAHLLGNLIGTDVTGQDPLPNGSDGIYLNEGFNTIGGQSPGEGNVIAFNRIGVNEGDPLSSGNVFWSNSIFCNGQSIRFGSSDAPRVAPPLLSEASVSGDQLTITGTMQPECRLGTGCPDSPVMTLEFFGNDIRKDQGQRFLGRRTLTVHSTDDRSDRFRITLDLQGADPGNYVTANETDLFLNRFYDTSPFSHGVPVTHPGMDLVALATAPREGQGQAV